MNDDVMAMRVLYKNCVLFVHFSQRRRWLSCPKDADVNRDRKLEDGSIGASARAETPQAAAYRLVGRERCSQ
jgi:hypothetical protein